MHRQLTNWPPTPCFTSVYTCFVFYEVVVLLTLRTNKGTRRQITWRKVLRVYSKRTVFFKASKTPKQINGHGQESEYVYLKNEACILSRQWANVSNWTGKLFLEKEKGWNWEAHALPWCEPWWFNELQCSHWNRICTWKIANIPFTNSNSVYLGLDFLHVLAIYCDRNKSNGNYWK